MLTIAVMNHSKLTDAALHHAIAAINRQFAEQFEPVWKFGAQLHLHADAPADHRRKAALGDVAGRRGDAVIYVVERATVDAAEGYHARNNADVPFGFVFVDVCEQQGDAWSVALSHEAIELVGDPLANLLVQGPSPHDHSEMVFYMFELCDPVTDDVYEIDGVQVANFVFPGWFAHGKVKDGGAAAANAHTDWLRHHRRGEVLAPFVTAPGGYVSFYDGRRHGDKWTTYTAPGDSAAEQRVAARKALPQTRVGRRGQR